MEIQTSLRNHEQDNKDTPSRQPRPPPEDRPISSTYPASQKKTAISRAEAHKVAAAAAEQEEAERRAAAQALPLYPAAHPISYALLVRLPGEYHNNMGLLGSTRHYLNKEPFWNEFRGED